MTVTDDPRETSASPSASIPHGSRGSARTSGALIVRDGALGHLVDGVIAAHPGLVRAASVGVDRLDADGCALTIEVDLPPLHRTLTDALAVVRRTVGREVESLLGRPVDRIDLVVRSIARERARALRSP